MVHRGHDLSMHEQSTIFNRDAFELAKVGKVEVLKVSIPIHPVG